MSIRIQPLLLSLSLLVAALVYSLALNGPFLLDDFHNLEGIGDRDGVKDLNSAFRYIFSYNGNEWQRSLARVTFLFNTTDWPSSPFSFKLTNLLIHLASGLTLYLFLYRLLKLCRLEIYTIIPLLVTAFWLLAPLHVSTVMYVVQRMTQLSFLFGLLALLLFVFAREYWAHKVRSFLFLGLSAFAAVLALLSKESAAILLLLIPLVDQLILRYRNGIPSEDWWDKAWRVIKVLIVLLLAVALCAVMIGADYSARLFTLSERLLIQGEIIARYIGYMFGVGFSDMTIYHDDMEWRVANRGVGLAGYWWIFHGLAIVAAVWAWRRYTLIAFGVLWFYLSHIIESTVIPLELMFEHRNYLASVGLLLAVVAVWNAVYQKLKLKGLASVATGLAVLAMCLSLIGLTHRSAIWGDSRILLSRWAAEHPFSSRAQTNYAHMFTALGLTNQALRNYDELVERFNDPTLILSRMLVQCEEGGSTTPIIVEEFIAMPYASGVRQGLERILKSEQKSCYNLALDEGIDGLIVGVEQMPLLKERPRFYALYLALLSGYYVDNGEFSKAAVSREKLFNIQPSIPSALSNIGLMIAGQRFDIAQFYIDHAYQLYSERLFPDSYLKSEIDRVQLIVDQYVEAGEQAADQ